MPDLVMKQLSETCRKPSRKALIKRFSYLLLFFLPALFHLLPALAVHALMFF